MSYYYKYNFISPEPIYATVKEELKSYFDEIDVIYAESEAPFNWATLLSHIRDHFEDWLEEGAWGFLLDGVS